MSELVFATFLSELKTSWCERIADPDLINLLYDGVSAHAGLSNAKGDYVSVSKSTASKIVNRQTGGNVNQQIRKHANDKTVTDTGLFQGKCCKPLTERRRG